MIYLDNSSTTHHKPISVIKSATQGLKKYSINPGRSAYKLAVETQNLVYECREKLSNMFGTTSENIIFTSGCTMAINLGLCGSAKKNGHIITTIYEHNSIMRTLEKLKNTHNITYTILTPNKNSQISPQDIIRNITSATYLVIVNHTSNVTGATQNIAAIGRVCKKHGLKLFVDAAQSAGHEYINMQEQNINMLSIAGHKGLYSPQGIGALLINDCLVEPFIYGGTGTHSDKIKQPTDYPDGLESGTQNIVGILGLSAGIDFVTKNQEKINKKISSLTKKLISGLNKIKYVETFADNINSGVVSIIIKNKDSGEVSRILDEDFNICTRSGLHCSYLIHKHNKTLKNGTTRISLSYFNTKKDIDKVLEAISKIALEY